MQIGTEFASVAAQHAVENANANPSRLRLHSIELAERYLDPF